MPPLAERVQPDKKAALAAAIAKSGMPAQVFDKLETWAAAFLLLGVQFKDLGLDPGSGVESALKKQFKDGGKSIGQLETNAEQLGFFDRLSEDAQRNFLAAVLEDPAAMKTQFGGMLAAWSRGDVKASPTASTATSATRRSSGMRCSSAATPIGRAGSRAGSTSRARCWSRSAPATWPATSRC